VAPEVSTIIFKFGLSTLCPSEFTAGDAAFIQSFVEIANWADVASSILQSQITRDHGRLLIQRWEDQLPSILPDLCHAITRVTIPEWLVRHSGVGQARLMKCLPDLRELHVECPDLESGEEFLDRSFRPDDSSSVEPPLNKLYLRIRASESRYLSFESHPFDRFTRLRELHIVSCLFDRCKCARDHSMGLELDDFESMLSEAKNHFGNLLGEIPQLEVLTLPLLLATPEEDENLSQAHWKNCMGGEYGNAFAGIRCSTCASPSREKAIEFVHHVASMRRNDSLKVVNLPAWFPRPPFTDRFLSCFYFGVFERFSLGYDETGDGETSISVSYESTEEDGLWKDRQRPLSAFSCLLTSVRKRFWPDPDSDYDSD